MREGNELSVSNNYEVGVLPDIEMYGGDTAPWYVVLVNPDGTPHQYNDLSQVSSVLTFTSYKVASGQGQNAIVIPPVLIINGEISIYATGGVMATFIFSESQTKQLHGKYVYQIEIINGNDKRISQGHILIKHNIHR